MNKVNMESIEKSIKEAKRLNESSESYFTKEEFMNLLNNTNFKYIKKAYLELITGFKYNADEDYIKELYKTIDIC